MISRQCPRCGKTSHSAGELVPWICPYCQMEIPPEKRVVAVVGCGRPPRIPIYDIVPAFFGLPTIEQMVTSDKSFQREIKRAERDSKPFNYSQEMARRRRQIEKGMIKVI